MTNQALTRVGRYDSEQTQVGKYWKRKDLFKLFATGRMEAEMIINIENWRSKG